MKRILSVVILLAIVSSCSFAFASEIQPRASELIVGNFVYAYDYGAGKVKFVTDITTLGPVDKLGFPSIEDCKALYRERVSICWSLSRS